MCVCVGVCVLWVVLSPQTAIMLQTDMNRLTFISVMQKVPFQIPTRYSKALACGALQLSFLFFFFFSFFLNQSTAG